MRNFGIILSLLLLPVTFVCSMPCLHITQMQREKRKYGSSSLNDLAAGVPYAGYGGRPPSYYGTSSGKAQASSAKFVIAQ